MFLRWIKKELNNCNSRESLFSTCQDANVCSTCFPLSTSALANFVPVKFCPSEQSISLNVYLNRRCSATQINPTFLLNEISLSISSWKKKKNVFKRSMKFNWTIVALSFFHDLFSSIRFSNKGPPVPSSSELVSKIEPARIYAASQKSPLICICP